MDGPFRDVLQEIAQPRALLERGTRYNPLNKLPSLVSKKMVGCLWVRGKHSRGDHDIQNLVGSKHSYPCYAFKSSVPPRSCDSFFPYRCYITRESLRFHKLASLLVQGPGRRFAPVCLGYVWGKGPNRSFGFAECDMSLRLAFASKPSLPGSFGDADSENPLLPDPHRGC